MDAPSRRILLGTFAFLVVGIAASVGRGDSIGFMGAFTTAVVVGSGLVLVGYCRSRRQP